MVAPLMVLGAMALAGGSIGAQVRNHYARQNLYNSKKLYDLEYNQYKLAKEQYDKHVGLHNIRRPFDFDYHLERNRIGYQNVEHNVSSNWMSSGMSAGYDMTANAYQGAQLYKMAGGKRWL